MNLQNGNLDRQLAQMLETLQSLRDQHEVDRWRDVTGSFMQRLFDLGLLLHREPNIKEMTNVKNFIEESGNLLPLVVGHINFYCFLTKDWFYGEWEYDEWISACKKRSSLEFLFELYANTGFQYFLPNLQTEAHTIDELLRTKVDAGVYTPYETIPQGMPTSHWWWWYPEDAPQL